MKTHQITINDTTITLKFGFGFLRLLGQKWNCEGPIAIINKFAMAVQSLTAMLAQNGITDVASVEALAQTLPADAKIDISFETIEVLADVVVAAAEAQKDTLVPDPDDVAEWLFEHPAEMSPIIELFMASMPQQRDEPKKMKGTANSPAPVQNP